MAKIINRIKKEKGKKLISLRSSKKKLWNEIDNYFRKKCKDEKCWLKQKEIKPLLRDEKEGNKLELFTFKPEYPTEWKKDKYTWLNTLDIFYCMVQAEKVYPNYKFYGPVPSDCPEGVNCELSKLDVNQLLKENIKKIGIVYNLDVTKGPGTHWVAIFIDIAKSHINYYDSYGERPIPLIRKFMERIYKQMSSKNKKPVVIYNDKRHQRLYSECGMFSMNFILQRLDGKTMYDIYKANYTDKQMNDFEKLLFV